MGAMIQLAEKGLIPDPLIRYGIRRLLDVRLREMPDLRDPDYQQSTNKMVRELSRSPIAIETAAANDQHYEVPADFFRLTLGKQLKYSSGYWDSGARDLDEAEEHMLALTTERAGIRNGMKILDMGCGWGSFSLRTARLFPGCEVHGVSNSNSQRQYIEARAKELGLTNLHIRTADMNHFDTDETFDRIVSVEMFEHMRNYDHLMAKISRWLRPGGQLFVHIFCHKNSPYTFETEGDDNWMGRYFFTGGIMPSHQLLLYFQQHLNIRDQWIVGGTNYEKTALAWLENTDRQREEVLQVLTDTYGPREGALWLQRWRIFFLSCAGLFGFRGGTEWWVSHYLFSKKEAPTP